jgi:ketosteroid isomerase-like protein
MSDGLQAGEATERGGAAAEHFQLARELYARFVRRDVDAMLELVDREAEWHNPEYAVEPGVRHGPDGFRVAIERLLESFQYNLFEPEEFIDMGGEMVVVVNTHVSGMGSGAAVEQRVGHLLTVRDGKLLQLEWFRGRGEALAAAGGEAPVMAADDIDRMRRAYEALSSGDLELVMELVDPEAVMQDRPEIPDPQTYRGHEGVRQSLARNLEAFETLDLIPQHFIQIGDRVVAVLRMSGRGKESGVPVEDTIAHLWTIRDGKAWRMQVYSDPEDAVAAAASA